MTGNEEADDGRWVDVSSDGAFFITSKYPRKLIKETRDISRRCGEEPISMFRRENAKKSPKTKQSALIADLAQQNLHER